MLKIFVLLSMNYFGWDYYYSSTLYPNFDKVRYLFSIKTSLPTITSYLEREKKRLYEVFISK